MKRMICGIIAIIGMFVAVSTKDGIEYELAIRGIGVAVFGIAAYVGGFMELSNNKIGEE